MDSSLLVVGGGAAGFFGALTAARAGISTEILEKGPHPLRKVKISGGGRCNVTHACFDPRDLMTFYPRGGRELRGAFHQFGPRETLDWFSQRGVSLKTESDGRIFPTTDSSQTIIDCLQKERTRQTIPLHLRTGVRHLRHLPEGGFRLTLLDGRERECRFCLLAPGSINGSPLPSSLRELGHHPTDPVPSLFTFHIADPALHEMAGLSVSEAVATIPPLKTKQSGPILITHWGLSGPAILKLSAWAARDLHALNYRFPLHIQWVPQSPEELREEFRKQRQRNGKKTLSRACPFALPRRLWQYLLQQADAQSYTWARLPGAHQEKLIKHLHAQTFTVEGQSLNKEEFVTCGGIPLREVDFRTMESRVCPGLYFAGEILDLDGVTGGFNFQAAWTTGYLAGQSIRHRKT